MPGEGEGERAGEGEGDGERAGEGDGEAEVGLIVGGGEGFVSWAGPPQASSTGAARVRADTRTAKRESTGGPLSEDTVSGSGTWGVGASLPDPR